MKEKLSKKDRLEHINEAVDRIVRFAAEMNYDEFLENEMAQYAIIDLFNGIQIERK